MPKFLRNDNYLLSSKRRLEGRELNMIQEHEVSNINYLLKSRYCKYYFALNMNKNWLKKINVFGPKIDQKGLMHLIQIIS